MSSSARRVVLGLGTSLVAASLFGASVASAQQAPTNGNDGMVIGRVAECVNGSAQPLANAQVGVEGTDLSATTDQSGQFVLTLPAGNYTIVALNTNLGQAARPGVPVTQDQTVDIGMLDLGSGVCLSDSSAPATAINTAPPTSEAQDNFENNGSGYDKGDDDSGGSGS